MDLTIEKDELTLLIKSEDGRSYGEINVSQDEVFICARSCWFLDDASASYEKVIKDCDKEKLREFARGILELLKN